MRRERVRPELLAAVAGVWLLGLALVGVSEAVAYLAPALLLALPLVVGRYPGEEPLVRALARRAPSATRRAPLCPLPVMRVAALTPRGGRLVSAALASRGPPAVALHQAT